MLTFEFVADLWRDSASIDSHYCLILKCGVGAIYRAWSNKCSRSYNVYIEITFGSGMSDMEKMKRAVSRTIKSQGGCIVESIVVFCNQLY